MEVQSLVNTLPPTQTDHFRKERSVLKYLGICIGENVSVFYEKSHFYSFVSLLVVYGILDIIEISKHDFEVVATFLVYVFATLIGLGKGVAAYSNRKQIGEVLRKLDREPFTVDLKRGGVEEQKIMDECLWITSWQFKLYVGFGSASIISSFLFALFNLIFNTSARIFTYGPLTFLDLNSTFNYAILTFFQHISIGVLAIAFVFCDLVMASALAHISYQFKMVQNNFRQLVANSYHDMMMIEEGQVYTTEIDNSKIKWKYLKKHLEKAVRYHSATIDIAKQLELILNKLLLYVFLGTLAMLCFLIFRANVLTDKLLLFRAFMEILIAIGQVFVMCYWGEEIVFASQEVGQGIYESNFVGTDIRFQKALVFVIRRSQNPLKLTAGNFTVISLTTFTWILKTSYSAYMIL